MHEFLNALEELKEQIQNNIATNEIIAMKMGDLIDKLKTNESTSPKE